ncbi:MAG: DNA-processing protein DprA [Culicoidibacterales bacterium]
MEKHGIFEKMSKLEWREAVQVCSWIFQGAKLGNKQQMWYAQQTPQQRQVYLQQQQEACEQRGIDIIVRGDEFYPTRWLSNKHTPDVLYAQGKLELLTEANKNVSVVGSRRPNPYSIAIATQFCQTACAQHHVIVSGLAQGIDSLAHQVACIQGGKTIAVLGFGHDYYYPKSNYYQQLKNHLGQHQLVISQYPPLTPIARWRFIERNFLIATLSPAIIVVQAKSKSGSLITAEMALESGSDVYIATGIYGDDAYAGGHELVEQGAIPFQYFQQIQTSYDKF